MRRDPGEEFPISCLTRRDVAGQLNIMIESAEEGGDRRLAQVKKFKSDDSRLTRSVCQRLANAVFEFGNEPDELAKIKYELALEANETKARGARCR